MSVPSDLLYSKDHEWVRLDGSTARVGITDFAQDALGDVVFVQAPSLGARVSVGDSFSEVESTKSVSDIYAPVTGTVSAVNADLDADPSLLNSDPYGAGWICDITVDGDIDTSTLMSADAYRALIGA
ncbi:MAG: glycine cleavage system protein GcvH [Ilumatobacteraceae bacterium]|jgi:glycine cleavage system H protein